MIIIIIITIIIIIIIIKKIFTNNEWMMSGSWIKFDEGLMTMDKFSNANGSNSLSRICLLWRDPCRGAVQYLSSLLDYLLNNNCK